MWVFIVGFFLFFYLEFYLVRVFWEYGRKDVRGVGRAVMFFEVWVRVRG